MPTGTGVISSWGKRTNRDGLAEGRFVVAVVFPGGADGFTFGALEAVDEGVVVGGFCLRGCELAVLLPDAGLV